MVLFAFTWFFIPETRGKTSFTCIRAGPGILTSAPDRTLEEIHEMFEARLPARRFKGYVCTGVEEYAAGAEGEKAVAKADVVQLEKVSGEV